MIKGYKFAVIQYVYENNKIVDQKTISIHDTDREAWNVCKENQRVVIYLDLEY